MPFKAFDTLVFAGGGNRCFWQAGLVTYLREQGHVLPANLIGTSAGAAVAASCLTIGPQAALNQCRHLFADNHRLFYWRDLARLKLHFAHQETYPAWIGAFLNADTFPLLKQSAQKLQVVVTHPAKRLGKGGSVAAGTLAYLIDKKWTRDIHPRLSRFLGLRQAFYDLQACSTLEAAQRLLYASAAAPPFMNSVMLDGQWAFDGGYIDNAPVPTQTPEARARTLVLLTRHYPNRPEYFQHNGRTYWQASQKIPVTTWDCTANANVMGAFELGYTDARRHVQRAAGSA